LAEEKRTVGGVDASATEQQRSELFLNARAQAMTRSGFEYILAKHVATAAREVPSIAAKSSIDAV
jgi:hypothetical protein